MEETSANANEWMPFPLCSGYRAVLLERLTVQVMGEGGVPGGHVLLWALGVLGDGQYEVLGTWPDPASTVLGWREVFENLRVRGVKRIRVVLSSESTALLASLNVAYPGTAFLSAGHQFETFSGLPRRDRRFVRAGADAMRTLQSRTTRAVARHGRFSNLADATAFVIDALSRAGRCSGLAGDSNVVAKRLPAAGYS